MALRKIRLGRFFYKKKQSEEQPNESINEPIHEPIVCEEGIVTSDNIT